MISFMDAELSRRIRTFGGTDAEKTEVSSPPLRFGPRRAHASIASAAKPRAVAFVEILIALSYDPSGTSNLCLELRA